MLVDSGCLRWISVVLLWICRFLIVLCRIRLLLSVALLVVDALSCVGLIILIEARITAQQRLPRF